MNQHHTVAACMTSKVLSLQLTDMPQVALHLFRNYPIDYIPVLHGRRLVGIVERRHFVRMYAEHYRSTLAAFVSIDFVKLEAGDALAVAQEIFATGLFPFIPVVDKLDRLVGAITPEYQAHAVAAAGPFLQALRA